MTSISRLPFLLLVVCFFNASSAAGDADPMQLAQRIYRQGILPSGEPLRGVHPGGVEVSGEQAACVMCHRRSGMGMIEGRRIVLPITGPFLLKTRADKTGGVENLFARSPDFAHAYGMNRNRVAYTDQSLMRAIRKGVNAAGESLDVLMPRFSLSDTDARMLADYIEHLSGQWSPGVTRDTLQFATVFTPDVEPAKRKAMLAVLRSYFENRNTETRLSKRYDQAYAASHYKTYRTWELQVWDLTGPPEDWRSQLDNHYRHQPVFALISGMSQGEWTPVHRFCERQALPCWFPTVDLPVVAEDDFYSTYFGKGVLLEAEVMARYFHDQHAKGGVKRIIQVRSDTTTATAAAHALGMALRAPGISAQELSWKNHDDVIRLLANATSDDGIMLWLNRDDLAALADIPVPAAPVYLSAILADADRAPLPPAWRSTARMVYPYELPAKRRSNMSFFRAWLKRRNIALVDQRVQADAYLACVLMAEQVDEMKEYLYRDYLLERAENKLSLRLEKANYRRLSLGPGQRFASKGGYVVRFASPEKGELIAETDWIVP